MAIELRNRLHTQFGGKFTLNATAVFDYPTIGGLAEYLVGQLPDAESAGVTDRISPEAPAESTESPEASQQEAQEESAAEAPSDPEPQADAAETT